MGLFQLVKNRPETSKCSRMDKRRMISQSQQAKQRLANHPQKTNQQSPAAPEQPTTYFNGLTLEQYFQKGNLHVMKIEEERLEDEEELQRK